MENSGEKIINLEEIKKEKLEKEEIPFLRNELKKIRGKTKEICDRKEEKPGFFHGEEIIDIDVDELTDDDLLLYKDLKEFAREKISFDEYFKELSLHRLSVGEHVVNIVGKKPNFDFRNDSRVGFLAWVANRAMYEYYRHKVKARENNKKAAA